MGLVLVKIFYIKSNTSTFLGSLRVYINTGTQQSAVLALRM